MTKRLQWLVFLAALCALVAIYFFTQYQIDRYANRPLPVREVPEIRPEVSVKTVTPGRYQSRISAFGSTEAHYSINLSAQVAGQVEQISPQFESGFRLKKDQEMLRLENSDYRAAVAAAKQQVAEARVCKRRLNGWLQVLRAILILIWCYAFHNWPVLKPAWPMLKPY